MIRFLATRTIKTLFFLFLCICFLSLPNHAQSDSSEKIKSVKTINGKFVQFVVGDYVHAQIKKLNGKTQYFFLDSYDLQYFLSVNQGKSMTFTYEMVDTYIGQNNGRTVIERIKSAKTGNLTFEKWWKDLQKTFTVEQIKKKYETLVARHTKN